MGDRTNIEEHCRDLDSWAKQMTCQGLAWSCREQSRTKESNFTVDVSDGGFETASDLDECLEKARYIPANEGPIDRYVVDGVCRKYPEESPMRADCEEIVDECRKVRQWPIEFQVGDQIPYQVNDMISCVESSAEAMNSSPQYIRIGETVFDKAFDEMAEIVEDEVAAFLRGLRLNSGSGYHFIKVQGAEITYSGVIVPSRIGWDIRGKDDRLFEPILYGVHRYSNLETHDKNVDHLNIHQFGVGFAGDFYAKPGMISLNLYYDMGLSLYKTRDISDIVIRKDGEEIEGVYELDYEPGFYMSAGLEISFLKGMFNIYAGVQYTNFEEKWKDVPLDTMSMMIGATADLPVSGVNIFDWTRDKAKKVVNKATER